MILTYILDTDIFTLVVFSDCPEYGRLHAHILQLEPADSIATSIVTYEEQTRGWLAYAAKSLDVSHQIKAYSRLGQHLRAYRDFEVVDFDDAAGHELQRLRKLKVRIGTSDLKIAAIALSRNAIVVSRNVTDFSQVPGLRVENWLK